MKNIIAYIILGLLILVGVSEVVVIGKAIHDHVNEPKKKVVEEVDYTDAAIVIGSQMIIQHNGWTAH